MNAELVSRKSCNFVLLKRHFFLPQNLSFVTVQESTKNDSFLVNIEEPLKACSIDEMKKRQSFSVSHQMNVELEGDFAIKNTDSVLEFTGPIYLYLVSDKMISQEVCLILFISESRFICIYQLFGKILPRLGHQERFYALFMVLSRTFQRTNVILTCFASFSLQRSCAISLAYFFTIFGIVSMVSDFAKHLLKGKPRAYIKIFHLINAICVLIGMGLSIQNVQIHDPNNIQFVLKDANYIHYFVTELWLKGVIVSMIVIFLYGLPYIVIFSVIITLLFK